MKSAKRTAMSEVDLESGPPCGGNFDSSWVTAGWAICTARKAVDGFPLAKSAAFGCMSPDAPNKSLLSPIDLLMAETAHG
jgi:hypothetical protein